MKDPNNNNGFGYVKKEITISPTFNTNKKELANKFIFRISSQMFRGYCYSCNNYGHKAMNCRAYGRKKLRVKNYNLKDNQTINQVKSKNYNSFSPL
jgi:hypothetical protein